MVNFFNFIYLSLVLFSLWSIILCMKYLIGLFFMCNGGVGCDDCMGVDG